MKLKSTLVSVAVSAIVAGVAGCGGASSESSDSSAASSEETSSPEEMSSPEEPSASPKKSDSPAEEEPAVITIKDFEFMGPETVSPGATVTVQNDDSSSHTVTAEEGEEVFDVVVEGGASETFKVPDEPGEYAYVCSFHPEMTATLVVE